MSPIHEDIKFKIHIMILGLIQLFTLIVLILKGY